jgi:hypothetical protein
MRHLRYSDIVQQEQLVTQTTRTRLPGFYEAFEGGIDRLLCLQQGLHRNTAVPTSPREIFESSAALWFFTVVFSFTGSVTLIENGYYAESIVLNRTITESLVQIRYFSIYPEEMKRLPSITGTSRKIQVKEMYEKIAPGFYDIWYKFSSEFTHAGKSAHVLKVTRDPASGVAYGDPGIVYKEDWCSMCFNEALMLLLGYLRAFPITFPNVDTMGGEFKESEQNLEALLNSHIQLKGGENDWHTLSKPFWKPMQTP